MKTKIYGAYDDLIEVEGAISEEFDCWDEKPTMTFSDGTKVKAIYDGNWYFKILEQGTKFIKMVEAVGEDQVHIDDDSESVPNYSGFILLDDGIEWMKFNKKKYKAVEL